MNGTPEKLGAEDPEQAARDRQMLIEGLVGSLRPIPPVDKGSKGPVVLNVYDGFAGRVTHQITIGQERISLRDAIGRAGRAVGGIWSGIWGEPETVIRVIPSDR